MTLSCYQCYETIEDVIGGRFERLGCLIGRHPWKVIVFMIILNGVMGVGILWLKSDSDISRVYTPTNSQAAQDEAKLLSRFHDMSGTDFYSHQSVRSIKSFKLILKPNNGTVLDLDFLNEVVILDSLIRSLTFTTNKIWMNYNDICALRNSECVVSGNLFLKEEFRKAVKHKNVPYPYFTFPSGESLPYNTLVAGIVESKGTLIKASHMKLQYYMRSDSNEMIDLSRKWQTKLVEKLKMFSNDAYDFAFSHSDSMGEELNSNVVVDIKLFSLTFTLMITFACLATYSVKHDCIGNRMFLGFAGVIAAVLSILASFGIVSACGVDFVSIVGNMPFLIIGIGIDDMFVLLSGLSECPFEAQPQQRIGRTMRTSGVAITITSLTDVLAFGAGASSVFKSVRNFCIYTSVAVISCYLNQALFFTACLAINEKRVNSKRNFICCRKTKSKEEMLKENASKISVFCLAGRVPRTREDVEGFPERLIGKYFTKFILLTPVKIFVLVGFVSFMGVSIYGVMSLKQGLELKYLVSEESYVYKHRTWQDSYFKGGLPITFMIDKTYDYSKTQTQIAVHDIILHAQSKNFISPDLHISWLHSYMSAKHYYDNSSEIAFIMGLQAFLQDPRYRSFKNDAIISNGSVIASRIYVFTEKIKSSQDEAQLMLNMRIVAANAPLSAIAFSPPFIFFEQYTAILPQTLQTLGIAIASVFLVTAIFMPHPLLLLVMIITMGMIITGIIGLMTFWNLSLSSITMIHLIMSVGFSIDFTTHICHAYMVAAAETGDQCVIEAIKRSGGPILNGAMSSFIGILILAFAKSYIFKSFFKVMLLVITLSLVHSLLFLPVILTIIGRPKKQKSGTPNEKRSWQESIKIAYHKHNKPAWISGRINVQPEYFWNVEYWNPHFGRSVWLYRAHFPDYY